MTTRFIIPYPTTKAGKAQWSKEYGLNAYWAGKHWAQRKEDAKYWHSLVRYELRRQGISCRLYEKPVYITFRWDDGLDVDNHAAMGKMIVDALKGVLIKNDGRRYYAGAQHLFGNAKVIEVEITDEA
ncbi:MAG: hypothetical protein VB078_00295 [Clostridiaceae bacterium]|nr:hypothetical protein [Clostridiaceae bacterium]